MQLLRNSVQSGLANMCWGEFCGSMISCSGSRPARNQLPAVTRSPYNGVGTNLTRGGGVPIQASSMCQPLALSWCSTSRRSSN
ncbi:MAG: hypothetical protein ACKPKO_65530 [Candidatus Fonsibacter sp.]